MEKFYNPPGLNHYVQAEAAAIGLSDHGENRHPVAGAIRNHQLRDIERAITGAATPGMDPSTIEESFSGIRDNLDSIRLAYRAATHMAGEAWIGLIGVADPYVDVSIRPFPEWLADHLHDADPKSEPDQLRDVATIAKTQRQAADIPVESPAPIFFQDENPHPPQDPSPGQLADPTIDPRHRAGVPEPDRTEVDPAIEDPDRKPGPRSVADMNGERIAESNRRVESNKKKTQRQQQAARDPAAPEQPNLPAIPASSPKGPASIETPGESDSGIHAVPPADNAPAAVFGDPAIASEGNPDAHGAISPIVGGSADSEDHPENVATANGPG